MIILKPHENFSDAPGRVPDESRDFPKYPKRRIYNLSAFRYRSSARTMERKQP